ncbi:MAG: hypothetical protein SGPRY_000542 [Prymnesium sp.]
MEGESISCGWRMQECIEERVRLRHSPEVKASLDAWWEIEVRRLVRDGHTTDTIGWADYSSIFLNVYKAMVPDFNLPDALACIEEDFEEDSHGDGYVDRREFYNAVFELADMWTHSTLAVEYANFLDAVLDAITTSDQTRSAGTRIFRSLEMVTYSGDKLARQSTCNRCQQAIAPSPCPTNPHPSPHAGLSYLICHPVPHLWPNAFPNHPWFEVCLYDCRPTWAYTAYKAAREEVIADAERAAERKRRVARALGRDPTFDELEAERDREMQRESILQEGMRALLQRNLTDAEVAHARALAHQRELRRTLGRAPNRTEIAHHKEASLMARLRHSLQREPTAAETAHMREKELAAEAHVTFGMPPNAWQLSVAREERLRIALREKLRRQPKPAEIAQAKIVDQKNRLTALVGREPTDLELEFAKDAEMIACLGAQLGRKPTFAEMAAAKDRKLCEELMASLGYKPSPVEVSMYKESLRVALFRAQLGREPSAGEALIHELTARNDGRPPTLVELAVAREGQIGHALLLAHKRVATPDEMGEARIGAAVRRARARCVRDLTAEETARAVEDARMDGLRVRLGREPTKGEVVLQREASVRQALRKVLGRKPSPCELAAEKERIRAAALANKLGREPTGVELAKAREEAVCEELAARMGHPPSRQELLVGRSALARQLCHARVGRTPTQEEAMLAREQAVSDALAASYGRAPTGWERREGMREQMMAEKRGRVSDEQVVAELKKVVGARLRASLGRAPTGDEMIESFWWLMEGRGPTVEEREREREKAIRGEHKHTLSARELEFWREERMKKVRASSLLG